MMSLPICQDTFSNIFQNKRGYVAQTLELQTEQYSFDFTPDLNLRTEYGR